MQGDRRDVLARAGFYTGVFVDAGYCAHGFVLASTETRLPGNVLVVEHAKL